MMESDRMHEEDDRLSNLSDDLIYKILSFIGFKHTIKISALSSRWRFIWTSLPYLNFICADFNSMPEFYKFIIKVLSRRNNEIQVLSAKLSFHEIESHGLVKSIVDCLFSLSVKQLTITSISCNFIGLWPHIELPALTTLHLDHLILSDCNNNYNCDGLLCKCINLKNLALIDCEIISKCFTISICHLQLSNLTLVTKRISSKGVNVVAPQLKNLTIINFYGELLISAPNLASLYFRGFYPSLFSVDGFHTLENVHLYIRDPFQTGAPKIIGILQKFQNVKFLTLNLRTLKLLFSNEELISQQPSPIANLKSLKICSESVFTWLDQKCDVTLSSKVKNYLLDSSPNATFTIAPDIIFTS